MIIRFDRFAFKWSRIIYSRKLLPVTHFNNRGYDIGIWTSSVILNLERQFSSLNHSNESNQPNLKSNLAEDANIGEMSLTSDSLDDIIERCRISADFSELLNYSVSLGNKKEFSNDKLIRKHFEALVLHVGPHVTFSRMKSLESKGLRLGYNHFVPIVKALENKKLSVSLSVLKEILRLRIKNWTMYKILIKNLIDMKEYDILKSIFPRMINSDCGLAPEVYELMIEVFIITKDKSGLNNLVNMFQDPKHILPSLSYIKSVLNFIGDDDWSSTLSFLSQIISRNELYDVEELLWIGIKSCYFNGQIGIANRLFDQLLNKDYDINWISSGYNNCIDISNNIGISAFHDHSYEDFNVVTAIIEESVKQGSIEILNRILARTLDWNSEFSYQCVCNIFSCLLKYNRYEEYFKVSNVLEKNQALSETASPYVQYVSLLFLYKNGFYQDIVQNCENHLNKLEMNEKPNPVYLSLLLSASKKLGKIETGLKYIKIYGHYTYQQISPFTRYFSTPQNVPDTDDNVNPSSLIGLGLLSKSCSDEQLMKDLYELFSKCHSCEPILDLFELSIVNKQTSSQLLIVCNYVATLALTMNREDIYKNIREKVKILESNDVSSSSEMLSTVIKKQLTNVDNNVNIVANSISSKLTSQLKETSLDANAQSNEPSHLLQSSSSKFIPAKTFDKESIFNQLMHSNDYKSAWLLLQSALQQNIHVPIDCLDYFINHVNDMEVLTRLFKELCLAKSLDLSLYEEVLLRMCKLGDESLILESLCLVEENKIRIRKHIYVALVSGVFSLKGFSRMLKFYEQLLMNDKIALNLNIDVLTSWIDHCQSLSELTIALKYVIEANHRRLEIKHHVFKTLFIRFVNIKQFEIAIDVVKAMKLYDPIAKIIEIFEMIDQSSFTEQIHLNPAWSRCSHRPGPIKMTISTCFAILNACVENSDFVRGVEMLDEALSIASLNRANLLQFIDSLEKLHRPSIATGSKYRRLLEIKNICLVDKNDRMVLSESNDEPVVVKSAESEWKNDEIHNSSIAIPSNYRSHQRIDKIHQIISSKDFNNLDQLEELFKGQLTGLSSDIVETNQLKDADLQELLSHLLLHKKFDTVNSLFQYLIQSKYKHSISLIRSNTKWSFALDADVVIKLLKILINIYRESTIAYVHLLKYLDSKGFYEEFDEAVYHMKTHNIPYGRHVCIAILNSYVHRNLHSRVIEFYFETSWTLKKGLTPLPPYVHYAMNSCVVTKDYVSAMKLIISISLYQIEITASEFHSLCLKLMKIAYDRKEYQLVLDIFTIFGTKCPTYVIFELYKKCLQLTSNFDDICSDRYQLDILAEQSTIDDIRRVMGMTNKPLDEANLIIGDIADVNTSNTPPKTNWTDIRVRPTAEVYDLLHKLTYVSPDINFGEHVLNSLTGRIVNRSLDHPELTFSIISQLVNKKLWHNIDIILKGAVINHFTVCTHPKIALLLFQTCIDRMDILMMTLLYDRMQDLNNPYSSIYDKESTLYKYLNAVADQRQYSLAVVALVAANIKYAITLSDRCCEVVFKCCYDNYKFSMLNQFFRILLSYESSQEWGDITWLSKLISDVVVLTRNGVNYIDVIFPSNFSDRNNLREHNEEIDNTSVTKQNMLINMNTIEVVARSCIEVRNFSLLRIVVDEICNRFHNDKTIQIFNVLADVVDLYLDYRKLFPAKAVLLRINQLELRDADRIMQLEQRMRDCQSAIASKVSIIKPLLKRSMRMPALHAPSSGVRLRSRLIKSSKRTATDILFRLIKTYKKSKSNELMIEYLNYLKESMVYLSTKALTTLVVQLSSMNMFKEAIEMVILYHKRGIEVNHIHFLAMLASRNAKKHVQLLYSIFNQLSHYNIKKTNLVYSRMLRLLLKNDMIPEAGVIVQELLDTKYPIPFEILSPMIEYYRVTNKDILAMRLFESALNSDDESIFPRISSLHKILNVCKSLGDWYAALKFSLAMAIKDSSQIPFDFVLYLIGISGRYELAKRIFYGLQKQNVIMVCRQIMAELLMEHSEESLSIYYKTKKDFAEPGTNDDTSINSNPDIKCEDYTYHDSEIIEQANERLHYCHLIMISLAKDYNCDDMISFADAILNSKESLQVSDVTINILIIAGLCKRQKYQEALKYYRSAVDRWTNDGQISNEIFEKLPYPYNLLKSSSVWFNRYQGYYYEKFIISDSKESVQDDDSDMIQSEDENIDDDAIDAEEMLSRDENSEVSNMLIANTRAIEESKFLLKSVNQSKDAGKLIVDLHKFSEHVACIAIYDLLEQLRACDDDTKLAEISSGITIITGRGLHVNASGKRRVLRNAMEIFISNIEPKGILHVADNQTNDGVLVIKGDSLQRWIHSKNDIIDK